MPQYLMRLSALPYGQHPPLLQHHATHASTKTEFPFRHPHPQRHQIPNEYPVLQRDNVIAPRRYHALAYHVP